MNNLFCTVLSKGRLYQAIALLHSMHDVMNDFHLHILCVDEETCDLLQKMNISHVTLHLLKELNDPLLEQLKKLRKLNEYCWTLKSVFIDHLMMQLPTDTRITYIDADLFFYSNPAVIFLNQPDCSVLLSRGDVYVPLLTQKYTQFMQELTGSYNSGFISFLNDSNGKECLKWWKENCLEECCDNVTTKSFGDQKYLDEMSHRFANVCDICTPGVNIGHWNYARYHFSLNEGNWKVDQSDLICYHYGGFRIKSKNEIIRIYESGRTDTPPVCHIYEEFLKHIIQAVENIAPSFDGYATNEDLVMGKINVKKKRNKRKPAL